MFRCLYKLPLIVQGIDCQRLRVLKAQSVPGVLLVDPFRLGANRNTRYNLESDWEQNATFKSPYSIESKDPISPSICETCAVRRRSMAAIQKQEERLQLALQS